MICCGVENSIVILEVVQFWEIMVFWPSLSEETSMSTLDYKVRLQEKHDLGVRNMSKFKSQALS